MKRALITGATGMVGSFALQYLLDNELVKEVVSIVRKPGNVSHKKLKEIIHPDFSNFSELSIELAGIDICIYCIGAYTNAVGKQRYLEITCDYQKALTDVLEKTSPDLTFALFSAAGADTSETSRAVFAKAKGMAENQLNRTVFSKKYIFRPGFIKPTGKKRPSTLDYKILQPLYNLVGRLVPSVGIKDYELAKVMVDVSLNNSQPSQVFENYEMKKMIT